MPSCQFEPPLGRRNVGAPLAGMRRRRCTREGPGGHCVAPAVAPGSCSAVNRREGIWVTDASCAASANGPAFPGPAPLRRRARVDRCSRTLEVPTNSERLRFWNTNCVGSRYTWRAARSLKLKRCGPSSGSSRTRSRQAGRRGHSEHPGDTVLTPFGPSARRTVAPCCSRSGSSAVCSADRLTTWAVGLRRR